MADTSPAPGRWAFRPIPPEPRSIVELIADGTLDAELSAQLWLLLEARVPIIVAAEAQHVGKTTLLSALLAFLPPDARLVELAGESETFDWLPQATELGWPGVARTRRRRRRSGPPRDHRPARPRAVRPHARLHVGRWPRAIAVRAASIGYGLAATIHADSLDDVFDALRRPPVRLADDELSHLGVVLVLRRLDDGRRRVVAAHYVRPVARDTHGHVQRLGPAVLATWDPADGRLRAFRLGHHARSWPAASAAHAGDFEIEVDRRREHLDRLVADRRRPTPRPPATAIRAYRADAPTVDAPRGDA